ncbi:hypothetical protein K8S19_04030 [bacterium]|nr:hypothetical protein [bacterium]
MMFKVGSQRLYGSIMAVMIVAGLGSAGWAKTKSDTGKIRTTTGSITQLKQDVVVLQISKQKTLAIKLSDHIRVYQDVVSDRKSVEVSSVVRVSGQGMGDELLAKKMVVLSNDEKMKFQKKIKSGTPYGEKMQKTEIKAQVIALEPLMLQNWVNQKIKVAFTKKHEIIKQGKTDRAALEVDQKVKISYRDSKDGLLAEKVVILPAKVKKSVKK